MITRNQYLEALETVDQYHRQLDGKSDPKTEISQWLASLSKKPSGKLCSLLLAYHWADGGKPFKYVEDVNEFEFMRLRNAGKKTWAEFCELLGSSNS